MAANKQIVDSGNLRLAMQPKIELPSEQKEIEAALEARGDLAFKVELEVLPQFELGAFEDITLERLAADVDGRGCRAVRRAHGEHAPHLRRARRKARARRRATG